MFYLKKVLCLKKKNWDTPTKNKVSYLSRQIFEQIVIIRFVSKLD